MCGALSLLSLLYVVQNRCYVYNHVTILYYTYVARHSVIIFSRFAIVLSMPWC